MIYYASMTRKRYNHSAYWYAYHNGWTYSEATSWVGKYLDVHTYRPRMKVGRNGEFISEEWFKWQNASKMLDSSFNPLLLCALAMVDIAFAMREISVKVADPVERDKMKRELRRTLRRYRHPFYYAQEKSRRQELAEERRRIKRRTTLSPEPTPEAFLKAWNERKTSTEAMIRLGSMVHDLECYVDNSLKFSETGMIVGRNGGIRGWINENLPELNSKYKSLMRYKAMAVRLRQVTDTNDPKPTASLIDETPRHAVVEELLSDPNPVFDHIYQVLEHKLSSEKVFLDPPKRQDRRRTRPKKRKGGSLVT